MKIQLETYYICQKKFEKHLKNVDRLFEFVGFCKNGDYYSECQKADFNNMYTWTTSLLVGLAPMFYKTTKDIKYIKWANKFSGEYYEKVFLHPLDTMHDIGFLYSPYSVEMYKLTGEEKHKITALKAADELLKRFDINGRYIDAWGRMDDDERVGRAIVDCMMNIPLLFWAFEETGNEKYKNIAKSHLDISLKTVIRKDFTTYHTYYFDINTGEPLYGKTAQGYSDDSCWARGQAWGIYGTALAYKYTKNPEIEKIFNGLTDLFISKLPADYVPYWDMVFSDGSGEERDSSAAAIAICGILEMNKSFQNEKYVDIAMKMLKSLSDKYNLCRDESSNAILSDAMYSKPHGHKAEANIWGDYFYMEALMRVINPDWVVYW